MDAQKQYLGKKIQISNSKIGLQLSKKIAPHFETNFEEVFTSGHGILESLARKTNCDVDKTDFLSNVYSLGKVAGGEDTLRYLNNIIENPKSKITEKDIMLQNLQSVFPDLETRFTEEELIEFTQLYIENPDSKEVKVVKMSYDLNLLLQYYKNTGMYKNVDIVQFVFEQTNNIVNTYNLNGVLDFDQKTKQDINTLNSRRICFSQEEQDYLNSCVQEYNNTGEKYELINKLNDFRIKLEKKTKVR